MFVVQTTDVPHHERVSYLKGLGFWFVQMLTLTLASGETDQSSDISAILKSWHNPTDIAENYP